MRNQIIRFNIVYLFAIFLFLVLSKQANAQHPDSLNIVKDLDKVVVTGQFNTQSLSRSVYKIAVIDKKKIEAKSAVNVQQVLNTELGIRFSNDMALGTANINIMGMSGKNIKILLDGLPIADRSDIRESLNQIDVTQIERIEIVEGPMSTLYGSDALAGVINIITTTSGKKSLRINVKLHEESAGKEYQPFAKKGLHAQNISGYWDNGKWNTMLSLMHYDFYGFGGDSLDRNHKWKPKEQWLPSVRIGYKKDGFNAYYRNDCLYEKIAGKSPMNTDTYKALNQFFITNRMSHQLQANYLPGKKWFLNLSANYTDYKRHTLTKLIDYATKIETLSTGKGEQDTAKYSTLNIRTTAVHHFSPKVSIQPGLEINREAASAARISGNPVVANYAVFISAEYKPVNALNIRPGLRINKNTLYDAPPFIPSLNMLYNINDNFSLRAAYARGYRAPALRELYFNFNDANHNIKGNPGLKAENSQSINTYITYKKEGLQKNIITVEAGGFYNQYSNLISLGMNPQNAQEYIMLNIDKHRTCGMSLTGNWEYENLRVSVGALLLAQYNKILNDNTVNNNNVPAFNWSPEINTEVSYQIQKTKTGINIFYKYSGKRNIYQATTDASGNLKAGVGSIAGSHFAEANMQQRITKFLSLQGGVKNLFNVTDIRSTAIADGGAHSGGSSAMPFSYGRSYFISLQFHYNKN